MKLTLAEAKRRLVDSGFQLLTEEKIQDGVRLECDGGVKVVVYNTGTFLVGGKPSDLLKHAEKVLAAGNVRPSYVYDTRPGPAEKEILDMISSMRTRASLFEEALSVISRNESVDPVLYAQSVLQKARTISAPTGLPQGEQAHG